MLTVSSQNLKHGALQDPSGRPEDRWPALAEVLRAEHPDILCLQELHGWAAHNHQQLFRAENDLGMRTAGWIPQPRSLGGTLILYRPHTSLVLRQWEAANSQELCNGLGVSIFDWHGTPLSAASLHLTPLAASQAEQEAIFAASRVLRYGGHGLIAGDINHLPLHDPAPDPATLPPLNQAGLYNPTPHTPEPNRTVAARLTLAGLTDAAHHLTHTTTTPDLRHPTAPTGVRRDQIWLTPHLLPTLTTYRRTPHPASDHHLISIDLDPTHLNHTQHPHPDGP